MAARTMTRMLFMSRHDLHVVVALLSVAWALGLAMQSMRDRARNEPAPTRPSGWDGRSLSLAEMRAFVAQGDVLVVDARPELLYRVGHIPGAINVPRRKAGDAYDFAGGPLATRHAQPIVVYCESISCPDASLLEGALRAAGYHAVAVFPGGWQEWRTPAR